jgi:putative transposase
LKAQLRQAKRELEIARQEKTFLKKTVAIFLKDRKVNAIEAIEQQADDVSVADGVCHVDVSESGYYVWRIRSPSQREQEKRELKDRFTTFWRADFAVLAVRRCIHAELQAQWCSVGKNRVGTADAGVGRFGVKARRSAASRTPNRDASHPGDAKSTCRQFDAERPNQVWLTDITYIDTCDGFLYTASVMDLYSRQIVGLAMADHMRSDLTIDTRGHERWQSPTLFNGVEVLSQ